MVNKKTMILPVFAAIFLAACGSPEDSGATSPTVDSSTTLAEIPPTTGGTVPDVPSSNPDNAPDQVVTKALLDLESRINVDPDDVTIVIAEQKTWNDGSLGCPEPGMVYTQALVDGSRVLLEVDGRLYAYHAGADGEPFLCESDDKDGGYDFLPPPGYDE